MSSNVGRIFSHLQRSPGLYLFFYTECNHFKEQEFCHKKKVSSNLIFKSSLGKLNFQLCTPCSGHRQRERVCVTQYDSHSPTCSSKVLRLKLLDCRRQLAEEKERLLCGRERGRDNYRRNRQGDRKAIHEGLIRIR